MCTLRSMLTLVLFGVEMEMGGEGWWDYWLGFSGQLLNSPSSLIVCRGQSTMGGGAGGVGTSQQIYNLHHPSDKSVDSLSEIFIKTAAITCKLYNNISKTFINYIINEVQYRFFQYFWHFIENDFCVTILISTCTERSQSYIRWKEEKFNWRFCKIHSWHSEWSMWSNLISFKMKGD